MTKKPQPSRKRKGRSKPLPKACIPQPVEGEREPMPLPRQRGPTAPPTATRMDMELVEPIDRALGAAHLAAPPSERQATDAKRLVRSWELCNRWRTTPLEPRILSQMEGVHHWRRGRQLARLEREDWR